MMIYETKCHFQKIQHKTKQKTVFKKPNLITCTMKYIYNWIRIRHLSCSYICFLIWYIFNVHKFIMKLLSTFLLYIWTMTEAKYLFHDIKNPSSFSNRHSMPIHSPINWQRHLAGSSSIMPSTRFGKPRRYMSKIPKTLPSSTMPQLSSDFGEAINIGPQMNLLPSYYWSRMYKAEVQKRFLWFYLPFMLQ